jgi:hypothetical protein
MSGSVFLLQWSVQKKNQSILVAGYLPKQGDLLLLVFLSSSSLDAIDGMQIS